MIYEKKTGFLYVFVFVLPFQRALPVKIAAAQSLLTLTRKVKKQEQREEIFHSLIHGKLLF
jgi:hypothetical protein